MKKTYSIIIGEEKYEIVSTMDNIAYVKKSDGTTGLIRLDTNEIVSDFDNYKVSPNFVKKVYYLKKDNHLWAYDVINQKMVVNGWEEVKVFFNKLDDIVSLKSPTDGKIHIFDIDNVRNDSILDIGFDSVEKICDSSTYKGFSLYLKVTKDDKKGIYHHVTKKEAGLMTKVDLDNVELNKAFNSPACIICSKGDKKFFTCFNYDEFTSMYFNEIITDQKDKSIIYCKKDNKTYIYDAFISELIAVIESENVKYLGDFRNDICHYFFETTTNNKHGLIEIIINRNDKEDIVKQTTILKDEYDSIHHQGSYAYFKKDGKVGIYFNEMDKSYLIDAKYDSIEYLEYNYLALHKGELCDIGTHLYDTEFTLCVTDCKITDILKKGIVYEKNGKKGLIIPDYKDENKTIIEAEYDEISYLLEDYFIVQKDGKKGVLNHDKIIIPLEYDEIKVGGHNNRYYSLDKADVLYFALKKDNNYEVVSAQNKDSDRKATSIDENKYNNVEFYYDLMALRDGDKGLLVDYNNNTLGVFSKDSTIIAYEVLTEDHGLIHYYCIDGIYYYYEKNRLQRLQIINDKKVSDHYSTTYYTKDYKYIVESLSKIVQDSFCSNIDRRFDKDAEKELNELYKKEYPMGEYPTLTLTRVKKNRS